MQAPVANNDQAEEEGGAKSTGLPPMLGPFVQQTDATPLPLSEAQRQLDESLKTAIEHAGSSKRCFIAYNACAITTTGQLVVLASADHTGFNPRDAADMANLKHLEVIEEAVRSQDGFRKLFALVFNQTPSKSKKGMEIVSECTGDASNQEASRSNKTGQPPRFCVSKSHDTPKSSETPACLGADAMDMNGVVFTLKSNVDNSESGAICIKTKKILNSDQRNTLLRFFVKQSRIIDMSK